MLMMMASDDVDVDDEDEVKRQTQISTHKNKVFATVLKANLLHCGEKYTYFFELSFPLSLLLQLLVLFVSTLNLLAQCNLTLSRNLIIIFAHLFFVQISNGFSLVQKGQKRK